MQQYLQDKIFKIISEAADEQAKECYVIGLFVAVYRDWETWLNIVTGKQIGRAHV